MPLVAPFDSCSELVPGIDEDVITSAVGVPLQEQFCLVEPIDNAIGRYVLRGTA